jgi:multisubunit Na+/H+ antiporter MnhE subunit
MQLTPLIVLRLPALLLWLLVALPLAIRRVTTGFPLHVVAPLLLLMRLLITPLSIRRVTTRFLWLVVALLLSMRQLMTLLLP